MRKISLAISTFLATFAPLAAFAQNQGLQNILVNNIQPLLNAIIPILITIGVVYFIWGIVQYVIADDEKAKDAGKNRMMWGLIGLFVIVTFWGLIQVIGNTLDVQDVDPSGTINITPFP
jgi:predicted membrane channel-forming protein YqfA (hemolysin III family)